MILISIISCVASILGLAVSLYVLYREIAMSEEVHTLKNEEEQWHTDAEK
jgi:hypothetical protein